MVQALCLLLCPAALYGQGGAGPKATALLPLIGTQSAAGERAWELTATALLGGRSGDASVLLQHVIVFQRDPSFSKKRGEWKGFHEEKANTVLG